MKTGLKALSIIIAITLAVGIMPCIALADQGAYMLVSQGISPQATSLDDLNTAKQAYRQAADEVSVLSAALAGAQADYDKAAAEHKKAKDDLDAKRAKLAEVEKTIADATEASEAAKTDLQTATTDLETAKQEVEKASGAIASVQANKADADAAVAAAQANLDSANAALDTAKAQIAKGSFGFFEQMGSTDALNALNRTGNNNLNMPFNKTDTNGNLFTSFTHQGEETDATSLENMKDSIQWMKRANELRAAEDVKEFVSCNDIPLKVSDTLMAMAQSDANWSDSHVAHADQTGGNFNVGENLAWNYGTDPFVQWYDREKEVYTGKDLDGNGVIGDGKSRTTGHYTNIVDASFQSTGFAICTRGTMNRWTTFGQTFSWASYNGEDTYTIDEYEARFMAYYESVKGAPERAVAAAKSTLAEKQFAAATAADALAAAQEKLASAEEARDSAAHRIEDAQATITASAKAIEEATELIEPTQAEIAEAEEAEKTAAEPAKAAKAKLDEAQTALNEGTKRQADAKAELDRAQDYYDTDLAFAKFTAPDACAYTGKALTPDFKSIICKNTRLVKDIHYTLSYSNNVKTGTARIVATGVAPYHGAIEATFEIRLVNIGAATVDAIPPQVFTGSAQAPNVVAKFEGKQLVSGRDYFIAYTGNVNVGTAKLTLNGKGAYTGSKSVTFQIVQASISKSSVSKVKAQKFKGKAVKPQPTIKFNGKKLVAGKDYTLAYKNNKKKGTGKIIVKGKGNFIGKKTVNFKIK